MFTNLLKQVFYFQSLDKVYLIMTLLFVKIFCSQHRELGGPPLFLRLDRQNSFNNDTFIVKLSVSRLAFTLFLLYTHTLLINLDINKYIYLYS